MDRDSIEKEIRSILEIHGNILKDHDSRIRKLEKEHIELRRDVKMVRENTEYIKGKVDTLISILQSSDTYTYLKYGGLIFLGGFILWIIMTVVKMSV